MPLPSALEKSHQQFFAEEGTTAQASARSKNGKELPSFRKAQKFVTIIVSDGPNEETFYVHKDFICSHSPFFDAAFNGNLIEGRSQVMRLPDVDPHVFGFVVEWIYKSDFDLERVATAAKLWILADRFLIPALQNKAMDVIFDICNGYRWYRPPAGEGIQCINLIYEAKGETILKRFMADKFASGLRSSLLERWKPFLPQEMTADIMMAYSHYYHGLGKLGQFHGGAGGFVPIPKHYYVAAKTGGDIKSAS